MKTLGVLLIMAVLVIATIGLSGDGPVWTRYVGAGTLFALLLLILTQLSNIPNTTELRKLFAVSEAKAPPPVIHDDEEEDSARARRTVRN